MCYAFNKIERNDKTERHAKKKLAPTKCDRLSINSFVHGFLYFVFVQPSSSLYRLVVVVAVVGVVGIKRWNGTCNHVIRTTKSQMIYWTNFYLSNPFFFSCCILFCSSCVFFSSYVFFSSSVFIVVAFFQHSFIFLISISRYVLPSLLCVFFQLARMQEKNLSDGGKTRRRFFATISNIFQF